MHNPRYIIYYLKYTSTFILVIGYSLNMDTPLTKNIDNMPLIENMTIIRDHDGITFKIKSELLEKFFSKNKIMNDHNTWLNYSGYEMPMYFESYYKRLFNLWGVNSLYHEGNINLSFLRIKGIKDGITITLPTVASKYELKKYVKDMSTELDTFYKAYIKNLKFEIRMSLGNNDQI